MTNKNQEIICKWSLLEKQEVRKLTEEELAQVSGGGLATSRDALRRQNEQQGWSGRPAY